MKMNDNSVKKNRVIVAMSGGVDSSVAAALLVDQGYDVVGVTLKLWDYDEEGRKTAGKTCCSLDDIADAKSVCDRLGIPFYAFNYKEEFQKHVIKTFVEEYHRGRTPNPCILCNQFIKFDMLFAEAKKMGAAFLATGHYARIKTDEEGVPHLLKGRDFDKDQSYVLCHLKRDGLQKILLPIGDYTKSEIRDLARKHGFENSDKADSMEICFIPSNDHAEFIAKNYPQASHGPGFFVDWDNNILGEHQGIEHYTIGQRKKLKIAFGERMYVAQIRPQRNEVVLAPEEDLYFKGVVGDRFHFLSSSPDLYKQYGVKLRYQRDEIACEILSYDDKTGVVELSFLARARAVTPGQALVLYDHDEVVGGGWISQSVK